MILIDRSVSRAYQYRWFSLFVINMQLAILVKTTWPTSIILFTIFEFPIFYESLFPLEVYFVSLPYKKYISLKKKQT